VDVALVITSTSSPNSRAIDAPRFSSSKRSSLVAIATDPRCMKPVRLLGLGFERGEQVGGVLRQPSQVPRRLAAGPTNRRRATSCHTSVACARAARHRCSRGGEVVRHAAPTMPPPTMTTRVWLEESTIAASSSSCEILAY
jgi:hypothetical protein